ncbi:MAG: hypothetical protein PHO35_01835 [Candidatus Cloacimonetes bacterium]|nr:hypothetical protein [Candidatus Cloacimonadota bacterium]
MRAYVLLVMFVSIGLSLYAFEMPSLKASASLGPQIKGACIGYRIMGKNTREKVRKQDRFINVDYFQRPGEKIVGLYGDIHFSIEPFYALLEMGASYVDMDHDGFYHSWMNSETGGRKRGIVPHISIGCGYQTKISARTRYFIEWDVGFKPYTTKIKTGLML